MDFQRSQYHKFCDKIGLHHESKDRKSRRDFCITKPDIWLWEFTEQKPLK